MLWRKPFIYWLEYIYEQIRRGFPRTLMDEELGTFKPFIVLDY